MQLQVETQIYKKNAIGNGINEAGTKADYYITYISPEKGIQVHNQYTQPFDKTGTPPYGNYVQINGDDISMWRANKEKMRLDATALNFYGYSGNNQHLLASYGDGLTLYKPGVGNGADVPVVVINSSGANIDGSVTIGNLNQSEYLNTNVQSQNFAAGTMLYKDPMFIEGVNNTVKYANSGSSNISWARTAKSSDNPFDETSSEMICTNIGTVEPGLGGFYWGHQSRANAIFLYRIVAKIPVEHNIQFASNATGNNYTRTWLTPNKGTGKFTEYVFKLICGNTGTFSTTGYFYIDGTPGTAMEPVVWQVAYAGVFDMTKTAEINNYITNISSNGIWVTPSEKKPTNTSTGAGATGTKIDGEGVGIYVDGTRLAQYGTTTYFYEPDGTTVAATLNGDGLNIKTGTIKLGNKTSLTDANSGVYIGSDGIALGANSVFKVTHAGALTAKDGTIGGWTIDENNLKSSSGTVGLKGSGSTNTDVVFWAGNATSTSAPFRVTRAGALIATSATFGGSNGITITSSAVTLGSNCSISWSNVTDTSTVANKSDIPTDAHITQITNNSISTATINATQINASTLSAISANMGTLTAGTISYGTVGSAGSFYLSNTDKTATIAGASRTKLRLAVGSGFGVDSNGTLYATGATIGGAITATSLTIDGNNYASDIKTISGKATTGYVDTAKAAAEKTATSYITNIDSNNGITIKPINTAGNDYIQINSTAIDFFHNGNSQLCIQDSWIAIGNQSSTRITLDARGTSPYIYMNTRGKDALRLDANGVTLYDETGVIGTQIKSGEIVLGAVTDYQTTITPDAFTMSHAQLGDLYSVELGEDETRKIDISSTVAKGKTKTGIKVAFTSSITVLYNWKGSGGQVTLGTYTTSEWGVGTTKTATGLTITRTAAQVFSIKNTGTTTVYVTFRMTTTAPGLHMHWSGDNNLLWSGGGWYMRTSQIAYLDEPVSSQLNGIVLVWGRFTGGNAVNAGWNCQYIPKGLISTMEGSEFDIMLVDGTTIGRKIVKVYDNRIEGGNDNNGTADVSGSGMTLHPASFVLRFVYGI